MLDALGVDTEGTAETVSTMTKIISDIDFDAILRCLILFVACLVVMKVILSLVDRSFQKLDVEKSLGTFVHAALRVLLWLLTICLVLGSVGVEMTSIIAVLSVAGLAVSLAIQGSLSNLAGGIQVLVSKPFKAGDYVDAGSVSGIVTEVGLVYTRLCTLDNKIVSVPNGEISSERIINYSAAPNRRVDLVFSTCYDAKPDNVKMAVWKVLDRHPLVLKDPEAFVRVSGYQDSSIDYTVRAWCETANYWDVYFDLMEQVKASFDASGVEMTYNHLNVQMIEKK